MILYYGQSLLLYYVLLFLYELLTPLQIELITLFLDNLLFFSQQIVIFYELIHFFNFCLKSIFQCVDAILQRNVHLTVSSFFFLCFPPFLLQLHQIFLVFLSQQAQLLLSFLLLDLYFLIEQSPLFYLFIFFFQFYSCGLLCFNCTFIQLLIQRSNIIIFLECKPGEFDGLFRQYSDFTFELFVFLSEFFNDVVGSSSFQQLLFQICDL